MKPIEKFFRDEDGQATTEYILLLSMAVSLILLVMKKLFQPLTDKLSNIVNQRVEQMFSPRSLHQFPMKR